jgi:hypothetical protein
MRAVIAIVLALCFLFFVGCSKKATKTETKLEEPKNHEETEFGVKINGSEIPPWSKFPMPEVDKEDKEKEEE